MSSSTQQVASMPMAPATKENKNKVLVLTSTSHLGKAIVTELQSGFFAELFEVLAGVPAHELPERQNAVKALGCPILSVDMEDVHKLAHTIQQANPKQIVLVGRSEPRNVLHLRNVIDAIAKFKNPPFLLVTSIAQADSKSNRWAVEFDEVESHLKASEVPNFCILRSLFHMENFLWFTDAVKEKGVLELPFERALAPVATVDVTRAIASILKDCTPHHGKTLTICGPESLTAPAMAESLSKALGKSISYSKMDIGKCRELLKGKGLSSTTIDPFISYVEAVDRGEGFMESNALSNLTGEPGMSLESFVKGHRALFITEREE